MELSVAFQGGGARVIELMAAAEACRQLQKRDFTIFRVSGASAGAIAAALYATNADIPAVVAQAHKLKGQVQRHFSPDRLRRRNAVLKLVRKQPLFEEEALRDLLIRLFEFGGVDAQKPIKSLLKAKMQLRILRSDIRYHNAAVATEEADYALWEALVDSSAIPFAFRVPGRRTLRPEILDGGLFQNLPAAAATENLAPNQVALGFSFEREATPDLSKASLRQYASAIITSLLNERLQESAYRIKPSNIIFLPSRRGTFDFTSIFTDDLYKSFIDTTSQVKISIEGWRNSVENLEGPDWFSDHPDDLKEHIRRTDEEVNRFFENLECQGYHAEEIHHEVFFKSYDGSNPDLIHLHARVLGAKNPGLQFLRFWFYDSESGPLKRAQISVHDHAGKPRAALAFPVRNTGKARSRSILLVLERPLENGDDITITKTEESFNSMLDYMRDGVNFQTVAFGKGRTAESVRVSVHFPKRLKPKFYRNVSSETECEAKARAEETGLQVDADFTIKTVHYGCITVEGSTSLVGIPPEQRRFVKVVYYRDQ